jgi:hypothetical protein
METCNSMKQMARGLLRVEPIFSNPRQVIITSSSKLINNIRIIFLILILVCPITFFGQNTFVDNRLKDLGRDKFDSVVEVSSIKRKGIVRARTLRYYAHYYKFDIIEPKYLVNVCFQVKELYDKAGAVIERYGCSSLEDEMLKYAYHTGKLKNFQVYHLRKDSLDIDNLSPKVIEKIRELVLISDKKFEVIWERKDYIKYKVNNWNEAGSFTLEEIKIKNVYPKSLIYWQVIKKKRHFELRIAKLYNDSLLCKLKFPFSNEFIATDDLDKIKKWISEGFVVKSFSSGIASAYESKSKQSYLVNFSLKKFPNFPGGRFSLLRSTQGELFIWVSNNSKYTLFNRKGEVIKPFVDQYEWRTKGKGDFLLAYTKEGYSVYNLKGERLLPFVKDSEHVQVSEKGIASYFDLKKRRSFYINLATKDTLKPAARGEFIGDFGEAVEVEEKGVIDSKGQWVVKPHKRTYHIQITPTGQAFIMLDEPIWSKVMTRPVEHKYVFCDLKNKRCDTVEVNIDALRNNPKYSLYLKPSSSWPNFFKNGYTLLEVIPDEGRSHTDSFLTLMDLQGKIMNVKRRYKTMEVGFNNHDQVIVGIKKMIQSKTGNYYSDDFFGIISKDGNEIIPCEYLSLEISKYGYIAANEDLKYGLIDFDGKIIIELKFKYSEVKEKIKEADAPSKSSVKFVVNLK